MKEIWKIIQDNNKYSISNLGRVKRLCPGKGTRVGKILVYTPGGGGGKYGKVCLSGKVSYVHHLVATAFLGQRPTGNEVNHKDGNQRNNVVANLEYCTMLENRQHAAKNGLTAKWERHWNAHLKRGEVRKIRRLARGGMFHKNIGEIFNVARQTVSSIIQNRSWVGL